MLIHWQTNCFIHQHFYLHVICNRVNEINLYSLIKWKSYNFGPFAANDAALALAAHPVVVDFERRQAVLFETRRMDGRAALATRNQALVPPLAVVFARAQTLGTEQRRRVHLHVNTNRLIHVPTLRYVTLRYVRQTELG